MVKLSVRPKISCVSPLNPDDIYSRFETFIQQTDYPIHGRRQVDQITLKVNKSDHHYWSPVLNILIDEHENGTSVRGRFGPEPAVWTMFMFFYFLATAMVFFSVLYGLAQWNLGKDPWALWFFIPAVLIFLGIIMAAQFGQKKGHEQTEWLMSFCDKVLKHDKGENE